jgi:hypothetical protein
MLKQSKNTSFWNKIKASKFIFAVLLCMFIGAVARFAFLGSIPPGLNRDEAALGYNAFSILQTGKDEWGVSFPIVYKSFGDYKLAGYVVALLPSVAILGLTEFAVRLPSVLAGVVQIGSVAYFVFLFSRSKRTAVTAAVIQALAPWALHYSKVAFEANLALALFVSGICLVLSGVPFLNKKSMCGVVLIFLSLLTYNAPLIILPFVLLLLLTWKPRPIIPVLLISVTAVIAFFLVYPATKGKQGITVFSDQGVTQDLTSGRSAAGSNIWKRFIYARPVYYFGVVAKNYLSSFNPAFLVQHGGQNPWHQAPNTGHVVWSMFALAGLGLIVGWRYMQPEQRGFFYGLFFVSPIPSAVTIDAPHATRMLLFLFMIGIFSAYGFFWILQKGKVFAYLVGAIFIVEILFYLHAYFVLFPNHPQAEWLGGMGSAITEAEAARKPNEVISIMGDERYAYIYPLFYARIYPEEYRKTVVYYPNDNLGLPRIKQFGHYRFIPPGEKVPSANTILQKSDGRVGRAMEI